MKLPNGYGSVIKLSGNRRKPYAVRISYVEDCPDGVIRLKRKYLAYFSKKDAALRYLADYNSGSIVPEHLKYSTSLTFAELYDKWCHYRRALKDNPSDSTWRNYNIAFNHFESVHNKKIINIKTNDLQECINARSHQSKTTVANMRSIVNAMYTYAIANEYTDFDPTKYLVYQYTDSSVSIHSRFSDEEIATLWKNLYVVNNVDILLIYIYTGMRPSELLEMLTVNVHLEERYMVGGLKTENGYDRIIPLCDKILPLVRNRYNPDKKYLINNKYGNHYRYGTYLNGNFSTVMGKLNMKHNPHDCRYTFAALADNANMNEVAIKIIMGHSLADSGFSNFKTNSTANITKGVYTQKTLEELLVEINKL